MRDTPKRQKTEMQEVKFNYGTPNLAPRRVTERIKSVHNLFK